MDGGAFLVENDFMELITQHDIELPVPTPIRVETALSRYPVHRLAKHGDIAIDIREKNQSGEVSIRWEVTHNSKFGQPGPLAYKLDTLIINRRIEEASRPIPRVIRLGSLKEIAAQLELGGDTNIVKRALRQNASTFITAHIYYKCSDGSLKTLEADFTRYSIVFTGEELPDGRNADAVYIVLNDIYMQVINGATTRPLDYDYLKSLPPAAQRFYELLSFQMYAAIKHNRGRARLRYSEFCTYAPLARQYDWNVVRPQLARIHAPHKKSGYIGEINFQEAIDVEGKPDWIMLYQPGPKARAEHRVFVRRGGPTVLEVEPWTPDPAPLLTPLDSTSLPSPLEAALVDHGITEAIARQLTAEHPEEKIRLQIEIVDWMTEKKPEKIAEPAAYLVAAIKNGHSTPRGFVSRAERQRREVERQAKERQSAEQKRLERAKAAREQAEKAMILDHWASLTPTQQATLQAEADAQANPEEQAKETGPFKSFGQTFRRHAFIRRRLEAEGKLPPAEA
jgi:hypothetical protein